jgi:fibronectin type 3 domain-containing protein
MIKTIALIAVALALMVVAGCGAGSDAPTGLTVTSTAPITLSWNSASGAVSYNVYRGTASGDLSTKTLLASNVTGTNYTDTSATAGTTYYYQVTAVNNAGKESGASNEVNAVSLAQTGGSFVLGGTKGVSQITLNWSNVTGAVSYNLYRSTISEVITSKAKLAAGISTTTYVDNEVTTGTTYYYQVTAVNADGIEFQVSNEAAVAF